MMPAEAGGTGSATKIVSQLLRESYPDYLAKATVIFRNLGARPKRIEGRGLA